MCFSSTASFIAAGVIGSVGVATLRHVRESRSLLFASVPMLFAVHQLTEGFVWLGLERHIGRVALDHVVFLFMLYAHGILPLLMPTAVVLMEPPGPRRGLILGLTVTGGLLCVWMIYALVSLPSHAFIEQHSIAYRNPLTGSLLVAGLYILATCGAQLLSSHRVVRSFGILNVVGLTIAQIIKGYAFASVWCFYAATMSVVIYWQFRQDTIDIGLPNGTSSVFRPFLIPWLRPKRPAPAVIG